MLESHPLLPDSGLAGLEHVLLLGGSTSSQVLEPVGVLLSGAADGGTF